MVGSAKGRSMSALTMVLPGKVSRTSTQAMMVPTTALIAATAKDETRLSCSAARVSGLLTTRQIAAGPSSAACPATAASGMSTMTLRYSVTRPTPSQVLRRTLARRSTFGGAGLAGTVPAAAKLLLLGTDAKALLDRHHHACAGIKEVLCLLYTSDAADDLLCVDLGGRRIIQK